MALASQTSRSTPYGRSSGRRWSRRRKRGRRARLFLVAMVGGALIAIFWWRPWSGPPQSAQAAGEPMTTGQNAATPAGGVGLAATNALSGGERDETSRPRSQTRNEVATLEMGNRSTDRSTTPSDTATNTDSAQSTRPAEPIPTPREETTTPPATTNDPAPTPSRLPTSGALSSPAEVVAEIRRAAAAQDAGRLVEARARFNRALMDPRTSARDKAVIRARMQAINETLVFSPTVVEGDPLTESYTIRSGDSLSKIAANADLGVDWRFIQRVNQISDPRRIRVGQSIKLVRGPFHATISKSEYRLDLFADMPTSAGGGRVFIASYPVGLGEYSSTPTGKWVVREDSRLINPPWTNPRTGEYFSADNPDNPIGERWVGLEGVDETTRTINGIGIHGTIEPDSIGTDASMGCVRMLEGDVDVVYELLTAGASTVEITP